MKYRISFSKTFFYLSISALSVMPSVAESTDTETNTQFWLWNLVGHLHPLAVHYPVALLCVLLLFEVCILLKWQLQLRQAVPLLLWITSTTAMLSVMAGFMLINVETYTGDTITWHQYLGIATMILSILALVLHSMYSKSLTSRLLFAYRLVLLVAVVGVTITGHLGANITHGSEYLDALVSASNQSEAHTDSNLDTDLDVAKFTTLTSDSLRPELAAELSIKARTVLAHNCYQCHSAEKMKGELRLDSRDGALKGGKNGPSITLGAPESSELIRRVTLPDNHKEIMPSKGKRLSAAEVEVLKVWIAKGAPWPANAEQIKLFREARLEPVMPTLPASDYKNPIDAWIDAYFKDHSIAWQPLVSDDIYIKRVYSDILGLQPTYEEVQNFSQSTDPNKRNQLVTYLLSNKTDYAVHWLTFWNDALRNDYQGPGYIDGGRFPITDWLYASLYLNKPYNQFVQELINPTKESEGFIKGIKWRGTVNASQRVEMQAAQSVAQVFLGVNLKCASCHDSFISNIKLKDAYAFANIFADSSLEINRCDKPTGKFTGTRILYNQLGKIDSSLSKSNRLQLLAKFMTKPENGRLYRTIVNRIWAQFMGRGFIEPVDAMDNLAWNQNLLDWLSSDFTANGSDVKNLIYLITTSHAYQLPSVAVTDPAQIASPSYVFKGMVRKKLSAEQFADAISASIKPMYTKPNLTLFNWDDILSFEQTGMKTYDWLRVYAPTADRLQVHVSSNKNKFGRDVILPKSCTTFAGLSFKMNEVAGYTTPNAYLKFSNLDLSEYKYVTCGYATGESGYFEIRLDSLNGTVVSIGHMSSTSSWDKFKASHAKLNTTSGKHDVYFVFRMDEQPNALFDLSYIHFKRQKEQNWVELPIYTKRSIMNLARYQFKTQSLRSFTRASCVDNDDLMKALGRPNREIVTTNRASQVSLLQALELTNGTTLNSKIIEGSKKYLKNDLNSTMLIDTIYKDVLKRLPTDSERNIAGRIIGSKPKAEQIQDLVWALVLLPEFQLIY